MSKKRTSTKELQHRYKALKEGLEIDNNEIMQMLMETRQHDDYGIEVIIKSDGAKKAINNFILEIEKNILSSQNIGNIYKYKKTKPKDWPFITTEEESILRNTTNFYKEMKLKYMVNRAELMIMRKEVFEFVRTVGTAENFKEMIKYIINNYTYYDTLKSLGFSPTEVEGETSLVPYKLDPDTLLYKV